MAQAIVYRGHREYCSFCGESINPDPEQHSHFRGFCCCGSCATVRGC